MGNYWSVEQINLSGLTDGPAVYGNVAAAVMTYVDSSGKSSAQSHLVYRDSTGKVWNAQYTNTEGWSIYAVNLDTETSGPAAASDPYPYTCSYTEYSSDGITADSETYYQLHILYLDSSGTVWDSWYDDATKKWKLQQMNGSGGLTSGSAAASQASGYVYNRQSHVLYPDSSGTIWDCYYSGGSWHLQQMNGSGGLTSGSAAAGGAMGFVYNSQAHVIYRDSSGKVLDVYYSGGSWQLQTLNMGGQTDGPAAVCDPYGFTYNGQGHAIYRDSSGKVWDCYYSGGSWNAQQINCSGETSGAAAAGNPSAYTQTSQFHILYRDSSGNVLDSWWDGGANKWNLQTMNNDQETDGPATATDPSGFLHGTQPHVAYCDSSGKIYDCYYS
jgi:hypothetical protein